MSRAGLFIVAILAMAASACGSVSSSKLDGNVKAAIEARQGGAVSGVACNDVAPPPDSVAGGLGVVRAEHTCTVTFSDGEPQQMWAVHVLDLIATHPVQLLYRIDHNSTPPPVHVNVPKAVSAQMATLYGATVVTSVHCIPGSPAPPAGSASFAPADHVCAVRLVGGRQHWAVRVVGNNVQLLFKLN